MYPQELVEPMENELVSRGFEALRSAKEVDEIISKEGTTLMVVNSVCGCAAGSARPGVIYSLDNAKKPSHLATVFAGVDREAVMDVPRRNVLWTARIRYMLIMGVWGFTLIGYTPR